MLVRAGEIALDGFNRFDGRVADLSLYFVLKTHALDFICFSPTSHLLQWERVREEL